jgi:tetratricopeptide (TPR) repeat protein
MIVHNEESRLGDCLRGAAGLTQETIVVDTGSTDRTKAIAAEHGAKVYDFKWIDDFAAARNESIRHATGDWIFWLDADDRIDESNRQRLVQLFHNLPKSIAAYRMRYSCWIDPGSLTAKRILVDQPRLFPNHPQIRWTQRVHEQILPAVFKLGGTYEKTEIVIDHLGYEDSEVRERKQTRNVRLLRLEMAENPNHPYTLFNLGSELLSMNRPSEAQPYLERALESWPAVDDHAAKLFVLLAKAHRGQGRIHQALEVCGRGRQTFPDHPELLSTEGFLFHELGELQKAAERFETLLQQPSHAGLAIGLDDGLNSHTARYNLGVIHRDQGRLRDAEAAWRQVLAHRPQWGIVLYGLGEILVVQKRWRDMEDICRRLEILPEGKRPAQELRAHCHLRRNELTKAKEILDEMTKEWPSLLWPKVLLSRVLLREGRDWAAAEASLRAILALDPNHKEATQNLAKLDADRNRNNL